MIWSRDIPPGPKFSQFLQRQKGVVDTHNITNNDFLFYSFLGEKTLINKFAYLLYEVCRFWYVGEEFAKICTLRQTSATQFEILKSFFLNLNNIL